jgi:hypothetical protein
MLLASEFFVVGLTKKKVYIIGINILSILLNLEPDVTDHIGFF